MVLQYTRSKQGNKLLIVNGYSFYKSSKRGEKLYWKCTQDERNCSARCVTQEEELSSASGSHDQPPDAADLDMRNRLHTLKQTAEQTQEQPCQIVANACVNMSIAVAGIFPTPALLTRTIQRVRKAELNAPANPVDLNDLQIPGIYCRTLAGSDFLLFDSGAGRDRILLFSTMDNLQTLSQCEHWYADGTFKSAPPIFKQIFTLHGVKSQATLPLIYGLLPNKQQLTYTRFLRAVTGLAATGNFAFNPQSILTDFELGCLNAFAEIFPGVQRRGCFFHFSQCDWKHIQQFKNILQKYTDEPDFALEIRKLPAIAFVPLPAVTSSFDILLSTPFYEENEGLLRPLLDYFEDVWIGRPRRGGRRAPLYPHDLWNCYQTTAIRNSRTNNSVQGWNRRFNTFLGASHPSIWKFIEKIKEEQAFTEMRVAQVNAGTPAQPRRKKYRDLETRLLKIIEEFDTNPVGEYLTGIAQNIGFYC